MTVPDFEPGSNFTACIPKHLPNCSPPVISLPLPLGNLLIDMCLTSSTGVSWSQLTEKKKSWNKLSLYLGAQFLKSVLQNLLYTPHLLIPVSPSPELNLRHYLPHCAFFSLTAVLLVQSGVLNSHYPIRIDLVRDTHFLVLWLVSSQNLHLTSVYLHRILVRPSGSHQAQLSEIYYDYFRAWGRSHCTRTTGRSPHFVLLYNESKVRHHFGGKESVHSLRIRIQGINSTFVGNLNQIFYLNFHFLQFEVPWSNL